MHQDTITGLYDRLNSIAQFTSGFHRQPSVLIPEIAGALSLIGFRNFAALTVNNFNIVQQTSASFAPSEKFFGRDLTAVIDPRLLADCTSSGAPIYHAAGLVLSTPFDLVYNNEEDQRFFAIHTVFRDRFTRGHMVVFGRNQDELVASQWRLQAIAQLAVEATIRLPIKSEAAINLSPNEITVLMWTYENKTAGEVATICDMYPRTVNYYLGEAGKKLGARNKGMAAKMAKEMGLF